jgi:Gram-negative bacterial TonB protein C-terminal
MSQTLIMVSALMLAISAQTRAQETVSTEQNVSYNQSGLRRQARIKGCSNDTTRSGPIKGRAIGIVIVDSSHQPQLSTLQIVEATQVSFKGARSLAARALADCRFEAALSGSEPVASWVAFRVATGSSGKVLITGQRLPPERPPVIAQVEVQPVGASSLYLHDDPRLEELPRQVHCGDSPSLGGERKREVTESEFFSGIHAGDGNAEVSYVVRPDGRVDESSLTIISSDNWDLARAYLSRIAECDFAPGRIEGQPVAVKVVTNISRHARRAM